MNNVVLICNEKAICANLKSNLMLLRKFDSILISDFLSAEQLIGKNSPKLIVLYADNTEENILTFIEKFKKIPILFITEEMSEENLLAIYEAGVTDYITTNISQTEFLVKVMLCLKKSIALEKYEKNKQILTQIGILKKGTDFYSSKYTPAVFKNLIKNYAGTNLSLLAIAPDIEIKNRFNLDYLAATVKQNLREDDTIGFCSDKLYILLPNTDKQGALDVYNKIKQTFESAYTISAGLVEIKEDMDYEFISKSVDEALSDALLIKNNIVVQEDLSSGMAMNWLDKSNKKHKNFKLFKKALLKKIETVIAPLFYQKQQIVEQRMFEIEVEQYTNEKESSFTLKKEGVCSVLKITYPGAVKINVSINKNIYEDLEPEYHSYELPKIDEKLINGLLDKFIKDFDLQ